MHSAIPMQCAHKNNMIPAKTPNSMFWHTILETTSKGKGKEKGKEKGRKRKRKGSGKEMGIKRKR